MTASGPRPNSQGYFHYGMINTSRTIILANSGLVINGKQRYTVNSVSFIQPDTPLKLEDYLKISGVFNVGSIPGRPINGGGYLQTTVMRVDFRAFIEIVFPNNEDIIQSWHLDGYSFFFLGMDGGKWTQASMKEYNLFDIVSRCTMQVYPNSWKTICVPLDNVGMWNLRSENCAHQYLGQQFYLWLYSPMGSFVDEYSIPNEMWPGRYRRAINGIIMRQINRSLLLSSIVICKTLTKDLMGVPRAYFDGAVQHGFCACGVYIIPVGQQIEIYWNGGVGSNNKAEVMVLAGLISFCDFLNIQELGIFGDSKVIIDHVRSKHVIRNINLSGWLNKIEAIWNNIKDYSIDHIDREKNKVADALSKNGLLSQHEIWMMSITMDNQSFQIQEFNMPDT